MRSLNLKTLIVASLLTLFSCTLIAQVPQGATNAQTPQGATGGQMPQRQAQPQVTPKDVAILDAALKYNKDPKSTLYQTHDPEIIKQDDVYYLFPSGCSVSSSTDLINWKFAYNVFESPHDWVTPDITGSSIRVSGAQAGGGGGNGPAGVSQRIGAGTTAVAAAPTGNAAPVPGAPGAPQSGAAPQRRGGGGNAPDVQLINGTYYCYYNVTAFAKNTSAIGVATNKTLNPSDTNFKWIDHGMVVQSVPNRDMWNAIDADLVMDGRQGWLLFGSFWGGIQMVKLAPDLLSIAKPEVWYHIAGQPRAFALDWTDPGDGTIEGAFIYKHFQYFYLFVSLDYCCRGSNSDYNVVVGRSRNVEGPYVDKDGKLMSRGGGTLIAKGNDIWAGVGHCSAYTMDGKSILIMHGYDKRDNGRSKLIIRELKWDRADWPSIDL